MDNKKIRTALYNAFYYANVCWLLHHTIMDSYDQMEECKEALTRRAKAEDAMEAALANGDSGLADILYNLIHMYDEERK